MKIFDKEVNSLKHVKKTKVFTFTVVLFLIFSSLRAEIKLPAIISSNMILQRNADVTLWGWADANEKITVNFSWLNDTIKVQANNNGNWNIFVKTTNSKKSQIIKFSSNTSNIVLENVLFGEVWLCSGQSNMEMSLNGRYDIGQPVFGANMAITKSHNSNLRLFSVPRTPSKLPAKDIKNQTSWLAEQFSPEYAIWQEASPKNIPNFSALAYFFGEQLQEVLDVPVALIHASWGGSYVESWISNEVINSYKELVTVNTKNRPNRTSSLLFNGMINPIVQYTIKGLLWYQGESNRNRYTEYKKLFPAMVKDWRTRWGYEFPIYYVQIAPLKYNDKKNAAFMREVQLQCLDLIPNSGIALTMDIGDSVCIHPPKKKEVADRLLFNALNKTYGYTTVDADGPTYESHKIENGGIILKFKYAEYGLYAFDKLKDFEIAGSNKVFYPADAKIIEGKGVFVKSNKVTSPVAIRYAWRNWVDGTLYDSHLLPASSFRTDNWNDATLHKQ